MTIRDRRKAPVRSTTPYVINVLAGGYIPQQANTTVQSDGSYLWIPDIPLGSGPHILYMADAKGYTGGVGPLCHQQLHRLTGEHV